MVYSKEDLRKIVYGADKEVYSHVVIYCDTWDYDDYAVCVEIGEDIENYVNIDPNSMTKIMEVYDLSMDLDNQLNEHRAYHLSYTPIEKNDPAYKFAETKHKGVYRKDGVTPYFNHPKNVAKLIEKYKGDSKSINVLKAASYLHDTMEDTDTTFEELVDKFDLNVAYLVKELTTDNNLKKELGKDKYLAYKLNSMTNYALDIKLCDRLDNISDLDKHEEEFRDRYIRETLYIINFITENRKLTQTQINIIKDINITLNNYKENGNNIKRCLLRY